jgi:hypothetical protein
MGNRDRFGSTRDPGRNFGKDGEGMKMKLDLPLVVMGKPSKYRSCSICEDGTKAVRELTIKTGINASTSVAYCKFHLNKMINDMTDHVENKLEGEMKNG